MFSFRFFLSVITPKLTQNTLKRNALTASHLKAKSLFDSVLLAREPAQYPQLRLQRYTY